MSFGYNRVNYGIHSICPFRISDGIDIPLYRGRLLEEYNLKYSFAEADFIVSNRIGSMEHKIDIMKGNDFYIQAKYDKRGRVNRVAHLLNPQGAEYEKSILNVPKSVVSHRELTNENYPVIERNIYIAIAMLCGVDKVSFDEREAYGRVQYENRILDNTKDNYPWIQSHFDALDNMRKGIYPNVSMGLDATNQALQLYAVLTGDLHTAKTCNVASGDVRADAYKLLSDSLNDVMNTDKFNRDNCKKALMITMYGSSRGHEEIIEYMFMKNGDLEKAKNDFCIEFGLGSNLVEYDNRKELEGIVQLRISIEKALRNIAPKAMETMKFILSLNEALVKREYYWTMPDNFNVISHSKVDIEYTIFAEPTNYAKDKRPLGMQYNGELFGANIRSKALPANVVQSVDGYVCREMIRRMSGEYIMTIHDAFYCLPEDMELMIQNYKDIMCELLDSNLLNDILSELSGKQITLSKDNGLTKEHIQTSTFILS